MEYAFGETISDIGVIKAKLRTLESGIGEEHAYATIALIHTDFPEFLAIPAT